MNLTFEPKENFTLNDLSSDEMEVVRDWAQKYEKKYKIVGRLV